MPSHGARSDNRPAEFMFSALQTTHQHADTKAGILAAAQAALVGTAGSWSGPAMRALGRGGPAAVVSGTLLAVFVCALLGGAGFLAATLRPRVLRPVGANRYSFVGLASGPDILPADGSGGAAAEERRELSGTIRFLSLVAVRKYRCLTAAVVCTAVMGAVAGLLVVLRPLWS
ncbi:hypothetical protein GCM10022403_041770 [Streptomyces coacervatus]|uniref:Pycsar effector protein domain-containing protein n=1 Tax=Streptomyces coacervatus TaxID=647381 RepID=A0ABP7HSL2_9ACTN|nr:hypothetical protein [Streptomyces coacervatus]MDF2267236.1 hypothetical protein [Streptomyces coacervatus]